MKVVLLDVDGVLVTGGDQYGKHLIPDLERDFGIPPRRLKREFFERSWPDIVTGKKPLLPELGRVLGRIAPTVDPEALLAHWLGYEAHVDEGLLSDIAVLRARGTAVYLATNQEHHRARYLLEELGLAGHVDGMFYSAALGHRKPDRGFFRAVQRTLPPAGEDIVFVDDSKTNVTAARRFGWRAIHWVEGMTLEEELLRAERVPRPG
ncbi:HAD-IA family hydrolase [Devosia rhizoryzae]|uniref:HAD-IA family hydrolase n=1 Tax=Devosia rhizoryzae TaxID=2774137 RepID=A0ABX7C5B0_9HYPH|nr:HAD-IA family hydrolase [Devosia rhizoryzae]QQR38968.1 HAD-IA family hydrolase [Devosia rhizoryzae]